MSVNTDMNVMIVDDYKTMLRVIRNLLTQIGFKNVDEASDGLQALDLIKRKQYGLVISDWNMEPMSGLDLLKEVRAANEDHIKNVPFIMITAESKMENVVVAKQSGVSNYIVKPFSAEVLKSKITSVLGDF
jgi:two-component system chemotaxis response regulator CheY